MLAMITILSGNDGSVSGDMPISISLAVVGAVMSSNDDSEFCIQSPPLGDVGDVVGEGEESRSTESDVADCRLAYKLADTGAEPSP